MFNDCVNVLYIVGIKLKSTRKVYLGMVAIAYIQKHYTSMQGVCNLNGCGWNYLTMAACVYTCVNLGEKVDFDAELCVALLHYYSRRYIFWATLMV